MTIEVKQPTFLLDKNIPTKVSYINEKGDNWKAIVRWFSVRKYYIHGFHKYQISFSFFSLINFLAYNKKSFNPSLIIS